MNHEEMEFQRLLAEAGLAKKVEKEIFSPAERVEKIKETLDLLMRAKEMKDEKLGKKLRRILRKKYGFSIREHMRIEVK
jgi:hypothetical protein